MSQLFIAVHWRLSDTPLVGIVDNPAISLASYHDLSFCAKMLPLALKVIRDVETRAVTGCGININWSDWSV